MRVLHVNPASAALYHGINVSVDGYTPDRNFSIQSADQNVARVTLRGNGTETLAGAGDPGIALHIDGVYAGQNSTAAAAIYDRERKARDAARCPVRVVDARHRARIQTA